MIEFKYKDTSGFNKKERENVYDLLLDYREHLKKVVDEKSMDFDESSINLPTNQDIYDEVQTLVSQYKSDDLKYIVVIGIGGSNLGAQAVYEAIFGELYSHVKTSPKILFADTVDSKKISQIINILKQDITSEKEVVFNLISKSGGTIEPIANFETLFDSIKQVVDDLDKSVVVTTGKDSKLWFAAKEKKFKTLSLPEKVGGRFSVLSSVGLFPLALAGVDIIQLLKGAEKMADICISNVGDDNPAMMSAVTLHLHMAKNTVAHNSFFFSTRLASVGAWWRQLVGESLGKQFDSKGKVVNSGIIPVVSIGSTDLHSMAQLYFGGPKNIFTTMITESGGEDSLTVPTEESLGSLVNGVAGKTLHEIMVSIELGVKAAYNNEKIPFVEVVFPEVNEETVGAYLQFRMIEIMYVAKLLNINAFDQPNVETYKKETKVFLEKGL